MLGLPSSISEQFNWASLQHLDGLWDRLKHETRVIDRSASFSVYICRKLILPDFPMAFHYFGESSGKVDFDL
jgi:hypothetical protein